MIVSAMPTGWWVELPFYPGCRYAAYKAMDAQQVIFYPFTFNQ